MYVKGDASYSNSGNYDPCVSFPNVTGPITITGNLIHDCGWCLNGGPSSSAPTSTVTVANNQIYNMAHGLGMGNQNGTSGCASGCIVEGPVYFYNNNVHDMANWDTTSNSYHLDGIHLWAYCSDGSSYCSGTYWNNVYVYNNWFHGDPGANFNSWVFQEENWHNSWAFNNVFDVSARSLSSGAGPVYARGSTIGYANNTFLGNSTQSVTNLNMGGPAITNQNNANCTGQLIGIAAADESGNNATTITALNHNYYMNGNSNSFIWHTTFLSFSQFGTWEADSGETNSATNASCTLSSSGQPNSGSGVLGAGVNLYSTCNGQPTPGLGALCYDIAGVQRPTSGAWTIGAYEAAAGIDYTLSVSASGTGSVTSSPSGISCPPTCGASYSTGTVVTLTASAGANDVFDGWSGAGCSGRGTCVVTMSAAQSVTATFTLNSNNLYCPQTSNPTWGSSDGPASLPTDCLNTALVNSPASGAVVNVSTSAQLTSALAAAVCGQTINLLAGATFTGNFTIPALNCSASNWLILESSAVNSLPAEGARYTTTYNGTSLTLPQFGPCYAGVTSLPGRPTFNCPAVPGTYTAQVISPNTSPALKFTSGTAYVRLIGLEITRPSGDGEVGTVVSLGNIGNIHNIIFDRVWVHGDENTDETANGISFTQVSYGAVVDSYFTDFVCISVVGVCTDAHAILTGTNNTNATPENVLKVVNNFIEASGENILTGGAGGQAVPENIEVRLNAFFKPLTWNPLDPSYNGGIGGHPVVVKNLLEFKNATLVLVEGNQFVNNWSGFTQNGYAWAFGAKSQASGSSDLCPICELTNLTARYNQINTVNIWGDFSLENNGNGAGGLAAAENNLSIHDNVIDNLGYATCSDCPDTVSTVGITEDDQYVSSLGQIYNSVSVNHNTVVEASTAPLQQGTLGLSGMNASTIYQMYDIAFTNNVFLTQTHGTQNTTGNGSSDCAYNTGYGTPMITACWKTYTFGGNCFVANGSNTWPGTNTTSVASFTALFTSYNGGDNGNYVLANSEACKGAATDGSDPGANIAAVASVIAGAPVPAQAVVVLSPASLSFGNVTVGNTSPPLTVTLLNSGSATLTISSIAITGVIPATPAQFSNTTTCGASLAAGANCVISVVFKPTYVTPKTATLIITTNATPATSTVAISGLGTCNGMCLYPGGVKHSLRQVNTFGAPLNSNASAYSHYLSILTGNTAGTYDTGATYALPASCVGSCSAGNGTYMDQGTTFPVLNFPSFDPMVNLVAGYGRLNNIILYTSSYNGGGAGNSMVPAYIFSQAWADKLSLDGVTMNPILTRANSGYYLPGDYIYVASSAQYWQMTKTTCSNPTGDGDTHDIRCKTGTSQPTCFTNTAGGQGTSPCTDGTAQWTLTANSGLHAPPLDGFCGANYSVPSCNSLPVLSVGAISGGSAIFTTNTVPYYPTGTPIVTSISTGGFADYNCASGCTVTAVGTNTVTISGLTGSDAGGSVSGTMSGDMAINVNSPNSPTTVTLATTLPVPWELPRRVWQNYLFQQMALYYANSIGYMGMGLTKGGESSQDCTIVCPFESANEYLTYEKVEYQFEGANGVGTLFAGRGNLNTNPNVEAGYMFANNIGPDNNALQANWLYSIGFYAGVPPNGALYHGGNLLLLATTVWSVAMPNSQFGVVTVQTSNDSTPGSTPGSCYIGGNAPGSGTCSGGSCSTGGTVGAMSADASCVNPPAFPAPNGYPGNLPGMAPYTNNMEEYLCDTALAEDSAYPLPVGICPTSYPQGTWGAPYKAAQAAYIGFSSGTAPVFTSGTAVSFTIGFSNLFQVGATGTPPPSLTVSGSLPSGVSFVDNGNGAGSLAGTPGAGTAGGYPLTFTATNSAGSATQPFTLTVVGGNCQGCNSTGPGNFTIKF